MGQPPTVFVVDPDPSVRDTRSPEANPISQLPGVRTSLLHAGAVLKKRLS